MFINYTNFFKNKAKNITLQMYDSIDGCRYFL